MQRLFSSFASGWPGTGLLLLRLVAGIGMIDCGVVRLWGDPATILLTVLSVLEIGGGLLLLAGLSTPIAGTLVASLEAWKIFLTHGNPWIYILLGTLGAALAMLGQVPIRSMPVSLAESTSIFGKADAKDQMYGVA
jgi:uncharacterized membrane protein YphA (DoxX/SURF4 family)